MPREMSGEVAAALAATVKRPCIIVRIETATDPVLVWSGIGPLEFNEETYLGVKGFGSISQPEESVELKATNIIYTLRGIPPEMIATVALDMRQNLPARMWWGFFDADGVLIPDPLLVHDGLVGVVATQEGPESCTVTVSVESLIASLKRRREVRATPEDQRIRHPDDRGFEYVAGLVDRVFPFGKG